MYGKHYQSMYTGSMYGAGPEVFAVWGYVISHSPKGFVELNPKFLAPVLGMSEDAVKRTIDYLCSPDLESRTKDHDGRRLLRVGQFLYQVPTQPKYRSIRDEDDRRDYMREYMAKRRAEERAVKPVNTCKHRKPQLAHTEAEAEAEAEADTKDCPPPVPSEPTAGVNAEGLALTPSPAGKENANGKGRAIAACPYKRIVGQYHEILPTLPKVIVDTEKRKRLTAARWRQVIVEDNMTPEEAEEFFAAYFRKVGRSDFLLGRVQPARGKERSFRADFEWLMCPSNFAKVLEGRYSR